MKATPHHHVPNINIFYSKIKVGKFEREEKSSAKRVFFILFFYFYFKKNSNAALKSPACHVFKSQSTSIYARLSSPSSSSSQLSLQSLCIFHISIEISATLSGKVSIMTGREILQKISVINLSLSLSLSVSVSVSLYIYICLLFLLLFDMAQQNI